MAEQWEIPLAAAWIEGCVTPGCTDYQASLSNRNPATYDVSFFFKVHHPLLWSLEFANFHSILQPKKKNPSFMSEKTQNFLGKLHRPA